MSATNLKISEKQKIIISNLISRNDDEVISLLQEFRDNGELFIVQPLLDMLFSNRSEKLKTSILEFLEDVKNQKIVPLIAQSIRDHRNNWDISKLISVCWQSSLDFSNEIDLFVDILCNENYQASFEAFTVIENSLGSLPKKQRNLQAAVINSKIKESPKDKQPLLYEMTEIIENFKEEEEEG